MTDIAELKAELINIAETIPIELSLLQMKQEEITQEAANRITGLSQGSNNPLAEEAVAAWNSASANHQERFWRHLTPAILATTAWMSSL